MARATDRLSAWVRSQYTLLPQRHALVLYRYDGSRDKPATVHTVGVDREKGRHDAAARELSDAIAAEELPPGGRLVLRAEDADGKELGQLEVAVSRTTAKDEQSSAPAAMLRASVELVGMAAERDADVHDRLVRGYERLYETLEKRHERDCERIAALEEQLAAAGPMTGQTTLIEKIISSVGPMIGPALPTLIALAAGGERTAPVQSSPEVTVLPRFRALRVTDAEVLALLRIVCSSKEILSGLLTALPDRQSEIEGVLEEMVTHLQKETV